MKKIGLIEGKGTGGELISIFKKVINTFTNVEFIEYKEQINTYWSNKNLDSSIIQKQSLNDAEKLGNFLQRHKDELCCVFRTALNAETLYYLRANFNAIKLINLENNKLLIIRDESQGFYSINDYNLEQEKINFKSSFSLEKFKNIINASNILARKKFSEENFNVWAIYKYHLFSNIFECWLRSLNADIKLFQPDTGIVNLQSYLKQPLKSNLLLIISNEVGDILYEFMLDTLNLGTKETTFTINYYTKLDNMPIYQTVHGSADDLSQKNIINPTATLKIAVDILSSYFGFDLKDKSNDFFKKRPYLKDKDTTTHYLELFLRNIKP